MTIWDFYGKLGKIVGLVESRRAAGRTRPLPGHTLYHFYVSPASRRARLAVYELGLAIPFKEVLVDEEAWGELVRQGGKDQVPCLRIEENGKVRWMYESADIVRYLIAQAASGG